MKPPFLGIIMLDTQFPRPLGDIGNMQSWQVPVKHWVVKGSFPDRVVASAASLRAERMLTSFRSTALHFQGMGAKAITTSCGFLVLLQADLQRAVRVPVVTSSLMQLPKLLRTHPRVGVLTISAAKLGLDHLRAAGVARDDLSRVVVQGVEPESEFVRRILGNDTQLNVDLARRDVVAAAVALKARAPDVTQVVLECTNMPPYAPSIEAETGFKTWSLLDDPRLTAWAQK
jgi:hypothetical protein